MTIAALPTFQDGVLTNAAMLNAIGANITALYQATMGVASGTPAYRTGTKPQLVLRITTSKTVNSNTETTVIWDTADVNTDAMWSSGGTVTINTLGTYRLSAQVGFDDGGWGDGMALFVCINGTTTLTNSVACWRDNKNYNAKVGATVELTPGSTITVITTTFASSSRHLLHSSGTCRFEATRIGPA